MKVIVKERSRLEVKKLFIEFKLKIGGLFWLKLSLGSYLISVIEEEFLQLSFRVSSKLTCFEIVFNNFSNRKHFY